MTNAVTGLVPADGDDAHARVPARPAPVQLGGRDCPDILPPIDWDDATIDAMQGEEFEQFLGTLFRLRGWHVTFTAKTGDQGADLIIARGPTKIAIQAKRYSHAVGNDAVQQVLGGKAYYECNHAIVITSNTFTKAARNLAQRARIGLWDREILKREVGILSPELDSR